jgi:hypothetical protein
MQALNSVKFGIYKEMVENDESFSKNLAMKKILGYTDKDIDENGVCDDYIKTEDC